MLCFRRPGNLKELLTHADVKQKKTPTTGNFTCNKKCANCPRMLVTTSITSLTSNYTFRIRGNLNWNSHYVLYIIECHKCSIQYLGQMTNSLSMRMTAHMTDIKKNKNTSVARHFNSLDHTPKDVKVSALTYTSKNLNVTLRHEEAVIFLMGTAAPSGLNVMT